MNCCCNLLQYFSLGKYQTPFVRGKSKRSYFATAIGGILTCLLFLFILACSLFVFWQYYGGDNVTYWRESSFVNANVYNFTQSTEAAHASYRDPCYRGRCMEVYPDYFLNQFYTLRYIITKPTESVNCSVYNASLLYLRYDKVVLQLETIHAKQDERQRMNCILNTYWKVM